MLDPAEVCVVRIRCTRCTVPSIPDGEGLVDFLVVVAGIAVHTAHGSCCARFVREEHPRRASLLPARTKDARARVAATLRGRCSAEQSWDVMCHGRGWVQVQERLRGEPNVRFARSLVWSDQF